MMLMILFKHLQLDRNTGRHILRVHTITLH